MSLDCLQAQFLEGGRGRILAVMRRPQAPAGPAVLVVPPFAEEMNKSRKMLTDVAQRLQQRAIATIMVDPYGTGDSEGEFREATCEGWIEDLARAATWSAAQGWPIVGLLCVRLGCLLGSQTARLCLPGVQRTVFWQPVLDGERFLTQFLRLRVAASMMDTAKESVSGLRQTLRDGRSVEVAGYELSSRLAAELDGLKLADLFGTHLGALSWMEMSRDAGAALPTASEKCVEIARSRGLTVAVRTVVGEPFWSSTEIVRIGEWVDATVEALSGLTLAASAGVRSTPLARLSQ